MNSNGPRSARSHLRTSPLLQGVLLAAAGLAGSGLLFWSLRRAEVAAVEASFELHAAEHLARTSGSLVNLLEQLQSTRALFESSREVEQGEFVRFTAQSLERCPALRAMLWIERREGAGGPELELRYQVGPEVARLDAAPGWWARLREQPRPGELLVSAPFMTAPQAVERTGRRVLAAVPHFDADGAPGGFVAALLDLEPLLAGVSGPPRSLGFELVIDDVTTSPAARLAGPELAGALSLDREERVGARTWRISCVAPPGFVAARLTWRPWVLLALGLSTTGVLLALLAATTSKARIQGLVEQRGQAVLKAYDSLAQEAQERLWAVSETKQLERQLREIIDLVPDMIYVKDWHGRFVLANEATAEAYGTTVAALTSTRNIDLNTDVGSGKELREERALMERDESAVSPAVPFVDARGRRRLLRTVKIPYPTFEKGRKALLCVATDITEQRRAADILRSQNRTLEMLARNVEPATVLADIVEAAEEIVPGLRCSILTLDPSGRRLRHCTAPSLPAFYNEAIDGLEIGPAEGSCGASAARGERVIVEDVRTHPNWVRYLDLAERAGVRACWSQPIRAADGEILGTFAMYYEEPRSPEPYEERLIESLAHLAGISLERARRPADAPAEPAP